MFKKTGNHILFILTMSICLASSASCEKRPTHNGFPIAENNVVIDGYVPMSKTMLPDEYKPEAEKRLNKILPFFKTPTQQLMPLGMYAMVEGLRDVETLKKLRSHGINLIHSYGNIRSFEKAFENFEVARRAGIGLLQNIPGSYMRKKGPDWLRLRLKAMARDRQLMLWYLPEESEPEDLEKFKILAKIIRSVDTYYRPLTTFVASGQENHWKDLTSLVDALILGVYPSMYKNEKPRADIRRYIDFGYKLGIPVIFGALEAYKSKLSHRWATPDDLRFDSYLHLISGSKGLFWYGHSYLKKNTELYETVLDIASEINGPDRLGEVFLYGERVDSIKCQIIEGNLYSPPATAYEKNWWKKDKYVYSSIQWLVLRHKSFLYIFAVNMNEKIGVPDHGGDEYAVKLKFKNLPESINEGEVLFENRKILIKDNSFTDTFSPIGTHIYKFDLQELNNND